MQFSLIFLPNACIRQHFELILPNAWNRQWYCQMHAIGKILPNARIRQLTRLGVTCTLSEDCGCAFCGFWHFSSHLNLPTRNGDLEINSRRNYTLLIHIFRGVIGLSTWIFSKFSTPAGRGIEEIDKIKL